MLWRKTETNILSVNERFWNLHNVTSHVLHVLQCDSISFIANPVLYYRCHTQWKLCVIRGIICHATNTVGPFIHQFKCVDYCDHVPVIVSYSYTGTWYNYSTPMASEGKTLFGEFTFKIFIMLIVVVITSINHPVVPK